MLHTTVAPHSPEDKVDRAQLSGFVQRLGFLGNHSKESIRRFFPQPVGEKLGSQENRVVFIEPCNVSIDGLIENHMVEGGYRVGELCTDVERNRDRG
jgi:hypothetical protein